MAKILLRLVPESAWTGAYGRDIYWSTTGEFLASPYVRDAAVQIRSGVREVTDGTVDAMHRMQRVSDSVLSPRFPTVRIPDGSFH